MSLDTRFTGCPVAPCKTGSVEFNQVMNLVCIRRYQKYFIFLCNIQFVLILHVHDIVLWFFVLAWGFAF